MNFDEISRKTYRFNIGTGFTTIDLSYGHIAKICRRSPEDLIIEQLKLCSIGTAGHQSNDITKNFQFECFFCLGELK